MATPNPILALAALAELEGEQPGQRFTTAEIARKAGAENGSAGQWTRPWREALYALMINELVLEPTGRPHRWCLSPLGRERTAT